VVNVYLKSVALSHGSHQRPQQLNVRLDVRTALVTYQMVMGPWTADLVRQLPISHGSRGNDANVGQESQRPIDRCPVDWLPTRFQRPKDVSGSRVTAYSADSVQHHLPLVCHPVTLAPKNGRQIDVLVAQYTNLTANFRNNNSLICRWCQPFTTSEPFWSWSYGARGFRLARPLTWAAPGATIFAPAWETKAFLTSSMHKLLDGNSRLGPYLVLALGIVALGFSGILVRWANAPGSVTGFYRMAIAVTVLAWPFARRQRKRPAIPRREVLVALGGGLLFAGDLFLWNTGVLLSGAVNPTLMGNTAPLWVGLGAMLFFRERLGLLFWLGLLLTMIGAVIVLVGDALQDIAFGVGTLLGLMAGVFYGAYFLVTQRGRRQLDSLSYFWLAAVSSTTALLVLSLITRQPIFGYSPKTYASLLALGLVVQVIGQFSFSYALGYLPASFVAPAGLGQPVMTAILAIPLLGENLTWFQLVGGVAVLGGVYIVHHSRTRSRHP
jgi:drug/metabolite transporter (DMT)-like permease